MEDSLHLSITIPFSLSACVFYTTVPLFMNNTDCHIGCLVIWLNLKQKLSYIRPVKPRKSPWLLPLIVSCSLSSYLHHSSFHSSSMNPLACPLLLSPTNTLTTPPATSFVLCLMYSNNAVCVLSSHSRKQNSSMLAAAALHCSDLIRKIRQSVNHSASQRTRLPVCHPGTQSPASMKQLVS